MNAVLMLVIGLVSSLFVEAPLLMLAIGGLHHYWPTIPALGYGALFMINLIFYILTLFYGIGKGLAEELV